LPHPFLDRPGVLKTEDDKTEDGRRKTTRRKTTRRKTEDGRRKTEDGRRKTEDGRRKTESDVAETEHAGDKVLSAHAAGRGPGRHVDRRHPRARPHCVAD